MEHSIAFGIGTIVEITENNGMYKVGTKLTVLSQQPQCTNCSGCITFQEKLHGRKDGHCLVWNGYRALKIVGKTGKRVLINHSQEINIVAMI